MMTVEGVAEVFSKNRFRKVATICFVSFIVLMVFGLLTRGFALSFSSEFGLHAVLVALPYSCAAYMFCATRLQAEGFFMGVVLYALFLFAMSPVMFGCIVFSGTCAILFTIVSSKILRRHNATMFGGGRSLFAFWFGALLYPATLTVGIWFSGYVTNEAAGQEALLALLGAALSAAGVWLTARFSPTEF